MAKVIQHNGHPSDKRYHVQRRFTTFESWETAYRYNSESTAVQEAIAGETRGIIKYWRVVDTQSGEETVAEQRTEGHKPRSESRFRRWLRTGRFSARVGVPEEGTEAS